MGKTEFNRATLIERYENESVAQLSFAYEVPPETMRRVFIRLKILRNPPGRRPLDGRWATHWRKCRVCDMTERPHHGLGMCHIDYRKWERAGRPEIEEWITQRKRELRRLYG